MAETDTLERIESLRAGLGASLDKARRAIENTRALRDSKSMKRIVAMGRKPGADPIR